VLQALDVVLTVVSLAVAAWAAVTAARDKPPNGLHYAALGAVELLILAWAVVAVVALAGGDRPAALGTFLGYLVVAVLVVPAGAGLARLEPTRWGSVIVAAACVILPVLVLRLHQVWPALDG